MKRSIFWGSLFCFSAFLFVSGFWLGRNLKPAPVISVVMPVYNRSDLVARAIESILNQTFADFEFIIVDDGSDEATKKILSEYAKADNRIHLLRNAENKGIAYARQRGLDAARGEFIAVMDSDDWSAPDRLKKSLSFMRDHPEIDAMTGFIKKLPKDQSLPAVTVGEPYQKAFLPGHYEVDLTFYNSFPNVASFYKRAFVQENNIRYNPEIISAEDYDFWRQVILKGGKMASVSDTFVYVRSHGGNGKKYYTAMRDNSLKIHRLMLLPFFKPTSEEVKFSYTLKEKCRLLSKMKTHYPSDFQVPRAYFEKRFNEQCPTDFENALFLTHTNWSDFIILSKDNTVTRFQNNHTGKVVKNDKRLTVSWQNGPTESFYLQEDGSYRFYPDGEILKFEHPSWKDDLVILEGTQEICRTSVNAECGTVEKTDKNNLIIHWENWPEEKFYRNKNNVWQKAK